MTQLDEIAKYINSIDNKELLQELKESIPKLMQDTEKYDKLGLFVKRDGENIPISGEDFSQAIGADLTMNPVEKFARYGEGHIDWKKQMLGLIEDKIGQRFSLIKPSKKRPEFKKLFHKPEQAMIVASLLCKEIEKELFNEEFSKWYGEKLLKKKDEEYYWSTQYGAKIILVSFYRYLNDNKYLNDEYKDAPDIAHALFCFFNIPFDPSNQKELTNKSKEFQDSDYNDTNKYNSIFKRCIPDCHELM